MTSPTAPVPAPVERDRRYFSLFEHNWDAVYSMDPLGNFTEANPAAERLTGYTRDELVAMNFAQLVAPEEYRRMRKEFAGGLAGNTQPEETVIIRKDGARRNVVVSTVPIKFGEEVAGLFGTARDITEQREIEGALRDSEERYRLMVDALPALAWRCDGAGLCVDCNERWHEYTGQTPDEVRGTGWMAALHPNDRARTLQKVKDDVAGGMIYQTEYRLRRAVDNTYRWHLVRALPVKDATGQITAWFGCAADIEDAKQAEQILLRSHQELDELVRGRTLELETANRTLRESELRFRSLAEEIPAVTYIAGTGQTAGTHYVSPQIQEMLGISAAEFVADPDLWFKVIHPEDRPLVWAAVERLRQHG